MGWGWKDGFAFLLFASVVVITVELFRTIHHTEMVILHGPSGRPALIAVDHGVLHFAVCSVPVWLSEGWSANCRKMSAEQALAQRDVMVAAATWQMGYSITPTPGSISRWAWFHGYGPSATIDPTFHSFAIGFGKDALMVPGTWFAFASAPWWFVLPVLIVGPTLRIRTHLRRRRRKNRGLCAHCGYDLRESPERCPECGAAIPS